MTTRGGTHFVDHDTDMVVAVTDASFSMRFVTGMLGLLEEGSSERRVLQVGTQELALYRSSTFFRWALLLDPFVRLAYAWAAYQQEDAEGAGLLTYGDFVASRLEHGAPTPSGGAAHEFLLVRQVDYLTVGKDYEVDALFRFDAAAEWLPMMQRRFLLPEFNFIYDPPQVPELPRSTRLLVHKAYGEDLELFKQIGDAPFLVL
jgi:hypothetical protein